MGAHLAMAKQTNVSLKKEVLNTNGNTQIYIGACRYLNHGLNANLAMTTQTKNSLKRELFHTNGNPETMIHIRRLQILHREKMSVKCIPPSTPFMYRKSWICMCIPNVLIFYPKHTLWVLVLYEFKHLCITHGRVFVMDNSRPKSENECQLQSTVITRKTEQCPMPRVAANRTNRENDLLSQTKHI